MLTGPSVFLGKGQNPQSLLLGRANRHGLIAGATGTGKTVTLQILANHCAAATESMMRLNAAAARAASAAGATATTDVTGFGLLGHLSEMLADGAAGARLRYSELPWLPGAERLGAQMTFPGGAKDNRAHFGERTRAADGLEEWQQLLGFSPETSGGLLMAVPEDRVEEARAAAAELQLDLREIGDIVPGALIELRR